MANYYPQRSPNTQQSSGFVLQSSSSSQRVPYSPNQSPYHDPRAQYAQPQSAYHQQHSPQPFHQYQQHQSYANASPQQYSHPQYGYQPHTPPQPVGQQRFQQAVPNQSPPQRSYAQPPQPSPLQRVSSSQPVAQSSPYESQGYTRSTYNPFPGETHSPGHAYSRPLSSVSTPPQGSLPRLTGPPVPPSAQQQFVAARRSETLPPQSPVVPTNNPSQLRRAPASGPVFPPPQPLPPNLGRSPSISPQGSPPSSARRPLPTPTPGPNATPPVKHQSIDLSRFSAFNARSPAAAAAAAATPSKVQTQAEQFESVPRGRSSQPPSPVKFGASRTPSPAKREISPVHELPSPRKQRPSPPRFEGNSRSSSPAKSDTGYFPPMGRQSPSKVLDELPPLSREGTSSPGQKFVPMWKRSQMETLTKSESAFAAFQPSGIAPSTPQSKSAFAAISPDTTPTSKIVLPTPTKQGGPRAMKSASQSPGGRPLPSAPAMGGVAVRQTVSASSAAHEDARSGISEEEDWDVVSDDGSLSVVSSVGSYVPNSPHYGILDLPSKKSGLPQPPSMPSSPTRPSPMVAQTRSIPSARDPSPTRAQPPAMGSPTRSVPASRPAQPLPMSRSQEPQSLTLKMASMGLTGGSSSSSRGWPADLPKLPRTPGESPNIQGSYFSTPARVPRTIDLDDEPPVSLRKSPQPRDAFPTRSYMQMQANPRRADMSPTRPFPAHTQARMDPVHSLPSSPRGSPRKIVHQPSPERVEAKSRAPVVKIESPAPIGGGDKRVDIPSISLPQDDDDGLGSGMPSIRVSVSEPDAPQPKTKQQQQPPQVQVFEIPGISIGEPSDDAPSAPIIAIPGESTSEPKKSSRPQKQIYRGKGLICGGCGGAIVGRIVAAMGVKWHPDCFKCTICDELLEHVSSYEHDGLPYCHLDYHENFAPKCYHCRTAIIEERFISLDDPALGKRTYHEQHFFCAECGDPFMDPSTSRTGELNVSGDGVFADDDVGFVVYRGHPYCEACHVRLRLPKCKRCKKSIRDHQKAVEALGGKWCWECFVCAGCEKPFDNPSFFERSGKPFCESCFSVILRNEI